MTAGRWIAALALSLVSAAAVAAAAPREPPPRDTGVPSVGTPMSSGVEPAIARQLAAARSAVERMLESEDAAPRAVAAAFGSLGELYLLYDLTLEAQTCLRQAASRDPAEPRWPYLLGVLLQGEGDLDGAAAEFRATLALRADDVPSLLRLGDVLLDGAHIEEGRAAFARALATDEHSAKALDGLGRAAFAAGDYATAVERYEAALAAQPGAGSVRYRLGLAYRALGSVERSRAELERSNQEPVTFPDPVLDASRRRVTGVGALILVGQIAARASADATAEARFRDAIALDAQSPEAHHALGAFLEERGRTSEAIEEYVRALDLGVANPGLALHTGRLLHQSGRAGDAALILERAAQQAPDASLVAGELASALLAAGEPERALAAYDRALGLEAEAKERARFLFHRATLLADAGRPAEAEADLREAVRLSPDLAAAHFNLGTLCARRGDLAEAATHLARAVELEPENAQAQLSLGMALLLLDRPLDARSRLETVLAARPDDPAIAHLLARLLAATSYQPARDAERALVLARGLVSARPTTAHLETMAMALATLGRFDEAIDAQERAVAASNANELDAARQRLALYREGRAVVDPWKR